MTAEPDARPAARRRSPRPRRRPTACPREVVDSVGDAGPRHRSGIARRRGAAGRPAAPPARWAHEQGGRRGRLGDRLPDRGCRAQLAAFVNGVLAHSLDYDDTHLPSVLHPSAARRARRPGRRASTPAPTGARAGPGDRGRPRDLRPARHGRLRRGRRQLGLLRARPARHLDLRRAWAARSPRRCSTPRRPAGAERVAHALGVAASMAAGIIEANRTGGTVKRMHCGWAAHAAVSRRRPGPPRLHRPADRARGPVRLLPGLAARRRSTSTAVTDGPRQPSGRCRGSSSSPTRPTTSPTPSSTRPPPCARAASRPTRSSRSTLGVPARQPAHDRRADRGQARAGDRLHGAVQRRRTPSRSGLLGGGGLGARPRRLHRRPRHATRLAAALMAAGRRRAPTSECAAIFPHQFPAVLTARAARRQRAGRGGAHHPRRPRAPAVVRRARHQVPRQRRARPRPTTGVDAARRGLPRPRRPDRRPARLLGPLTARRPARPRPPP